MSVEVKLELGHRAVEREKQTAEGFTHDWTVFVRGSEGHDIQFFVEKIVFNLHQSFHKPKRVFKEPPYSVSESGYAGFTMPIDVYFRTKEEPRKVTYQYDLFLRVEGPPVSHIRLEKLTFQNPSPDFLSKLLKAGGLPSSTGSGSTSISTPACVPQHAEDHQPNLPSKPSAEKKYRAHIPSKEIVPKSEPAPVAPKPSQPFTDIFGPPIRKKESGHSSQAKHKSTPNSSSSVPNKEGKTSTKDKESHKSKDSHHVSKESHHPHTSKETPSSKDALPTVKEPQVKDKDIHPPPPKDSQSSKSHSSKEKHSVKESHSKEGHKSRDSHHSSKSKTLKDVPSSESKETKAPKSSKSGKESSKSSSSNKRPGPTDSHSSHGSVEKKKKLLPSPVLPSENSNKSSESKHAVKESKDKIKKANKSSSNPVKKKEEKPKRQSPKTPPSPEPKEILSLKPKPINPSLSPFKIPSPAVKPNSQHNSSPLPSKKIVDRPPSPIYKSPLPLSPIDVVPTQNSSDSASMDSDSDISRPSLSPLSNDEKNNSDSPVTSKRKLNSDYEDDIMEQKSIQKPKKHLSHRQSSGGYRKGNGAINNEVTVPHSPDHDFQKNFNNSKYREELLELQQIIMTSNDRDLLQNIVDLIEKTGKYEITNTTFDFDLCSLEPSIIHELKVYLKKLEVNT